ncbi:Histone-lysine N-methyltransferase [Nymphaea thermarum]|nr:Histone-lysine N-methyltransferase [Nymphaea thermarum]
MAGDELRRSTTTSGGVRRQPATDMKSRMMKEWHRFAGNEIQSMSLMAYITSTLSQEILASVSDDITAKELWDNLVETSSQVSEVHVLHLKGEFYNLKRGSKFIMEYSTQGFFDVEKKADWSSFHDHCSMKGLKYPFLVKRLSCMVLSGAAPAHSLDILQPAVLPSNLISELNVEFQLLRSILGSSGVTDDQLLEWYINVLSRIRINSFRVELVGGISEDLLASAVASISAEASVGNAIYMIPSFYNHDCDPNAHIIWIDSSHARMKALSNIEPGEEIRICYIDASMDHEARQVLLYKGFGFKCKCLRCLSGD